MSEARKLMHTTTLPMRWGDMDAYGHINNTVYFRFMEQARIEWVEQLGVVVRPGGDSPVIINASCTFLMPLTYPGNVVIRTSIGKIGRSSVDTYVDILLEGDDRIYAQGASKVVWMNTETGKSAPIPDHVRAVLEAG